MANQAQKTEHVTSELILYQTADGKTKVEVRLQDETVWLSQKLMAELFQTTPQNITIHLKNIFNEGELDEGATCKDFLQVQAEGSRQIERKQRFYNLDAIISVGYRIKSHVATRFRQWATQRLREYIIKGFTLDDDRLKQVGGGHYFDELMARIRDIRSSEKVFWRKVLDICSTSIDSIRPTPSYRSNPSPLCKTRCIGLPTDIPLLKSLMIERMRQSRIWA